MARAREKSTHTVKGHKLVVYKMGKRWRWMLMRDKKIVNSGSTETRSSALRDGKAAASAKPTPKRRKKATKRKTTKRKTTKRPTRARKAKPRKAAKRKATRRRVTGKESKIVNGHKLTVYKMGNRWRWMLMRAKKIVASGAENTKVAAEAQAHKVVGRAKAGTRELRGALKRGAADLGAGIGLIALEAANGRAPKRNGGPPTRTAVTKRAMEKVASAGAAAVGTGIAGNGKRRKAKTVSAEERKREERRRLAAAMRRDA